MNHRQIVHAIRVAMYVPVYLMAVAVVLRLLTAGFDPVAAHGIGVSP